MRFIPGRMHNEKADLLMIWDPSEKNGVSVQEDEWLNEETQGGRKKLSRK